MNDIENKIADMSDTDAFMELMSMGGWMKRFAKDNEHRATRLAQIVKRAKKGYLCPPSLEEATALVKRTTDESERILKWLRLIDKAAEKMDAEAEAAAEKEGERK